MKRHDDEARPSLPALLRAGRRVFGHAMRKGLMDAGHDDIPGNGLFVIGALARSPAPLSQIIAHLGVSKQAAGQLIDTLERRGYLQRSVDADDRRRLRVGLSARGRAAAQIIHATAERIEAELVQRVGSAAVVQARTTLLELIAIGAADADSQAPATDHDRS